jgi:hypothetical protein
VLNTAGLHPGQDSFLSSIICCQVFHLL